MALNLLTVTLPTVASLAVTEIVLQLLPRSTSAPRMGSPDRGVFCQYDPLLGYDGVPGLTANWPTGFSISMNADGNRDRPRTAARQPGATRVVMLGDSFVWGYDVPDGQRVSDRLPQFVHRRPGDTHDLEAINLAVSGYGTDQESLKYWLKGRKYQPDAVVVSFFSGNDPLENSSAVYWGCPKPRLVVQKEKLILTGVPVSRIAGWSNNSVISPYGVLRRWAPWSALIRELSEREFPPQLLPRDATAQVRELRRLGVIDGIAAEPATDTVDPMAITRAIADRLQSYLQAQHTRLVVLLVPSAHLYAGDRPEEATFYSAMRGWAEERHVPYVDYLRETEQYRSHYNDLYLGINEHWNAFGHETAARLLGTKLNALFAATTQTSDVRTHRDRDDARR
jgi:hypothetical protein